MTECSMQNLINFHEKGDDKDISDMSFTNQGLDKVDQCVSKVQHDESDAYLAGENNDIEKYYTPVQTVCRRVDLKDGSTYFDTPRPGNVGNHGHQLEYGSPTPKSSWPFPVDLTEDRLEILNDKENQESLMLFNSENDFPESYENEIRSESVDNESNEDHEAEYSPIDEREVHPHDISSDSTFEMEKALPKYKQNIQEIVENSHNSFSSQMNTIFNEVQKKLDTQDQKLQQKVSEIELDHQNHIERQTQEIYNNVGTNMKKALSEFEESLSENIRSKFDSFDKNIHQYIESKVKDEIVKSQNFNDDTVKFINNVESIIDDKVDKHIRDFCLKFDYDKSGIESTDNETGKQEINHQKNILEDKNNNDLVDKLSDFEKDMKDQYSEIDKKTSNIEISLKKIHGNNFEPEITQSKINEYSDKFNTDFRKLQDLNKETDQKIQFIENDINKLKQDVECLEIDTKINDQLENKFKEYDGKINYTEEAMIKLENKYQELSDQTIKIFDTVKKEADKVDVQINALKKNDEVIEQLLFKEIQENENLIINKLKEDREAKLAQMIAAVKEEAAKVMERVDILEAADNTLNKILKDNEEKIMKMIEEDKLTTDKIIQERIREAVNKFTNEYCETAEQRILEAVQQYEDRVNKLEDTSFELENVFSEEIKTTKENKLRSFEEDNQKLKESKREYKEKLLEKDLEIQELKVTVKSNHSLVIRLEEDKASLEKKVNDLRAERKQLENKVKDYENKFHEADKRFRTKVMANDDDLRRLKQENEKYEKWAQKAGSEKAQYKRLFNIMSRLISKATIHKKSHPFKTCIVLGSGGHTMEMIQLLREVDFNSLYRPRIYVVAQGDHLSSDKIKTFESRKGGIETVDFLIKVIPRSRNVGQSWLSTPFSVLNSLLACIKIILFDLPDLIICNGPGSCIPVCILGIKWIKLIYVESFARVHTLSLSGKLLLKFVDRFIVQWPYLEQKYPQAEYKGILV
ncbi:19156_t:CDS:2 [Gigaspora margarita]|uniref:UDP-N-acetylglucosamine transferase subunit ALG14 n=1 Tax=Gigaspora margarita TaxID=4874 RepID=A0ABN7UY20_GIGMA|nr:19156_t:CDS:2 [Gigaspora margarita]